MTTGGGEGKMTVVVMGWGGGWWWPWGVCRDGGREELKREYRVFILILVHLAYT